MVRILNGTFGLAIVVIVAAMHPDEAAPIWNADPAEIQRVADLETAFSAERSDPALAAELADEYLHQGDPELALAALRSLDTAAQRDALVQHRLALAYADMGMLPDAVASARVASVRCQRSLEAPEVSGARCTETTLTRIELHRSALERLLRWGIVDPFQDPRRTRLAYELSYRVARLALSRR